MSFLGVAFLFALPLVAAPLILHLLDRRRNVAIEWGAMEFLVAASARKSSTRRLKQWLLLLLRMLAVAALIFALARPLIPSGWLGATDRGETIFVVDNSMSTSRIVGDQTLMQAIIGHAGDELSKSATGDRVRFLTTAPYPIWLGNGGTRTGGLRLDSKSKDAIAAQFDAIEPTQGGSDLLAGLMTAVQADADPTTRHRRIVLLTDGQAADWHMMDTKGWEQFRATLSKQTIATKLQIVDMTKNQNAVKLASKGNVAVDEVRLRRPRAGIDQAIVATAVVHNHDSVQVAAATSIVWQVDGKEVASGLVDTVDPLSSREVTWTHSFDLPGSHRITARIAADDDLPADNHASVVVQVVDEIPILVVESQWELADTQQDSFFVRAALGWLNDQSQAGNSIYKPTIVSDQKLDTVKLNDFHVVVVPSLHSIDRRSLKSLHSFVVDGGGLWVGLGARTDIDEFNGQWFAGGSGLSPLSIDRVVSDTVAVSDDALAASADASAVGDVSLPERQPLQINPFGSDHPAVAQIADNQQSDLGDVVVDRRVRFSVAETNEQPSLLLNLSNGDPLAVEQLVGRGRVIVQAIPLRMQWSDLARSQSFVVMVHDWIDYLSQPRSTQFNLQPGDAIVYRSDSEDASFSGMLTTPQGEAIELASDGFGEAMLQTNRTSLPGAYTLETSVAGESIPFQVVRDNRESDLSPLEPPQQKQLAQLSGIESKNTGESPGQSAATDPLWPYLLLGVIALITMELLLAGVLARERFGVSGLSDNSSEAESTFAIPETKFPPVRDSRKTSNQLSSSGSASTVSETEEVTV
ncbi:MAG: BatA domain-containing protein [Pirellulaceae bacterium]